MNIVVVPLCKVEREWSVRCIGVNSLRVCDVKEVDERINVCSLVIFGNERIKNTRNAKEEYIVRQP